MDRLERALTRARQMRMHAQEKSSMPFQGLEEGIGALAKSSEPISRSAAASESVLEANRLFARLPGHRQADLFRILRTKVQQLLSRDGLCSIGVTSPNYGDGKTTIAANLALSLSLDVKQSVCLVDLDLRAPSLNQVFGLKAGKGLSDILSNNASVSDCLVRPPYERIVVLPNCSPVQNSSELLGAPAMAALTRELKTSFSHRVVIYDLPPVLPTDDTLGFLPNLDAVIVVIREGITPVEDLKRCLHTLGGTPLLGTVLNRSQWRDRSLTIARSTKRQRERSAGLSVLTT